MKWWREWRAWVAWQRKEREKQLISLVIKECDPDYSTKMNEYRAKSIIDLVRSFDKGNYCPPEF
jgi:hypothetical protein